MKTFTKPSFWTLILFVGFIALNGMPISTWQFWGALGLFVLTNVLVIKEVKTDILNGTVTNETNTLSRSSN